MPDDPLVTKDIVAAIRSGDRDAFDALFARVGGKLHVYVFNRMGDRLRQVVEPEDILQDVYLIAFRSFDSFVAPGQGSLARWLITIARNHIRHLYDHYFEQGKRDPRRAVARASAHDVAQPGASPSAVVARDEEVLRASQALASLCEEDREAILLHIEGESTPEIARRLGVPRTTLLYRISTALERLSGLIDGPGD